MKSSVLRFAMLGIALLLITPGCKDYETPRSRVLVTRVADSKTEEKFDDYYLTSDVIGDDSSIYEDAIFVTFENQPRSGFLSIDPTGPYGAVILTSYRVAYNIPGEHIEPLIGSMSLTIPSGETAMANIVVVTAQAKLEPPLSTLRTGELEMLSRCMITFYGHEDVSNQGIVVELPFQINFANWAG